jgi:hypothetical protein
MLNPPKRAAAAFARPSSVTRVLAIDGIGFWSPGLAGWDAARAVLRGALLDADAGADAGAGAVARRPAPALLAANERRRAPDSVLLALEVASGALAASGHAAADVASVFTSAHGDLAITDAMCRTLAGDPLLMSPTRFHHSVHNAASGYWAIASGSRQSSTALAAHEHSFGAGLLEAACLCAADDGPVLLVGYDTEACGALASVNASRGLLAVALVLAPAPGPATRWTLQWSLKDSTAADAPTPALHSVSARALAGNAMAAALPLFEALAAGTASHLALAVSTYQQLALQLQPHEGSDPAGLGHDRQPATPEKA